MTPQEDGSFEFSFNLVPSQARATLKDTFEYIASRNRKIVIAIDEFQQIRNFPEKGVEALLRSYVQFAPNAHFVFAGSQKHMMDEMFVSPKGPFYQSTQLMSLGAIDPAKYSDFAMRFFRESGRHFDPAAFAHLYGRFEGVTWYVQTVLNRIWASGRGLDSAAQIDETISGIVDEASLFYHDLLLSQTAAERSILKAIGREGAVKSISSAGFIRRYDLPSGSTIRSAAANLKKRDLIYPAENGIIVYDRFFGLYLSRL